MAAADSLFWIIVIVAAFIWAAWELIRRCGARWVLGYEQDLVSPEASARARVEERVAAVLCTVAMALLLGGLGLWLDGPSEDQAARDTAAAVDAAALEAHELEARAAR